MKTRHKFRQLIIRRLAIPLPALLMIFFANAQVVPPPDRWPTWNEENQDQTLSPYFFVQSDDPSTDRLPLKETRANVNIAGVIADVTITQTYKNEGQNALEAIYVFPASTRAAVYSMTMTIGEREIVAIIQESRKHGKAMNRQGKKENPHLSLSR